jgi:hypothetical protein
MPDWLIPFLVGGSSGGLFGYWLRARIDERFAKRTEARQFLRSDLEGLRDDLLFFLGDPRAHFEWLQSVRDPQNAGGFPTPNEKAQIIAGWVYHNFPRFPEEIQRPMTLVLNVTYQLARGDRHFLDTNPQGEEAVYEAWSALEQYEQKLTNELRGNTAFS